MLAGIATATTAAITTPPRRESQSASALACRDIMAAITALGLRLLRSVSGYYGCPYYGPAYYGGYYGPSLYFGAAAGAAWGGRGWAAAASMAVAAAFMAVVDSTAAAHRVRR